VAAKPNIIAEAGLQFFGRISASISHELKNVLGIFNENAGLLEDLTYMADQGKPIDPARLGKMAETLKRQIGRADEILKNMNRFAHTIDESVTKVNLHETISLFLALTERFTTMRGYKLDLQPSAGPLMIPTAPFFLLNLLWLCLEFSMSAAGEEKSLNLSIEEKENRFQINFQRLHGINQEQAQAFPSETVKELLSMLGADLTVEPDSQKMVLRLSKSGI
jgi:C4-dicarboxylate-specific signal transduction histidine kinase